jgi:predicted transcriptional regulator
MAGDDTDSLPVELMRRAELLEELSDGPKTPAQLENGTSLSRSTVHRATGSLVERGVLAEDDGTYELTGLGRVAAGEVLDCRTRVRTADRLEPLLDVTDASEVTLPLAHLAEASVTRPSQAHAHAPTKRITDLLGEADRVRLFSRVVSPVYFDIAYREVQAGTEVAAIFDRRVVEILFSEYGHKARKAARTGRFEVRAHDSCPFELFICDDTVCIAAHDDGSLSVVVESDDPEVFAWAESLYDRYVDRSEYVTLF